MPNIEYVTLYEDDMVILMNTTHPFANKNEVTLAECRNENFINLNQNSSLQHFIDQMWESENITPHIVMTCDYTLRDLMVSKNYGISITTLRAAKECSLPDVTFCKIKNLSEKRKLGLVWQHSNKMFSLPMQKFYDVVRSVYNF